MSVSVEVWTIRIVWSVGSFRSIAIFDRIARIAFLCQLVMSCHCVTSQIPTPYLQNGDFPLLRRASNRGCPPEIHQKSLKTHKILGALFYPPQIPSGASLMSELAGV
jgi:hypothetical protein